MFGLSSREFRFVIVISAIHLSQHFFMRLIPPLIPVLAVAFEYPLWQLGLLVSMFSLGAGVFQAPFGLLADQYDRLYLITSGVALMGFGFIAFSQSSVLGHLLPSVVILGNSFTGAYVLMLLAMLIAGIGAAATHPAAYPMITDNVSVTNKGKVLGAFGSSAKFGDAVAPAIVGVLLLVLFWEYIVLLLGTLGVITAVVFYLILRTDEFETVPASKRRKENTKDATTVSFSDIEKRRFLYPLIIIYLFFISKNFSGEGLKTYLPAFIVVIYAYSFDIGGVYVSPESAANFYFALLLIFAGILQLFIGGLTDTVDNRLILLIGSLFGAVGYLSIAILELGPVTLFLALCIAGLGIFGLAPARDSLISDISPPELEGRTFGYIWTAIMVTSALMTPVVGYIIDVQGMRSGFLILTGGIVFAAAIVLVLFSSAFTVDQHVDNL